MTEHALIGLCDLLLHPLPREQSRREHRDILDAALARDTRRLLPILGEHITKGGELLAIDMPRSPRSVLPSQMKY